MESLDVQRLRREFNEASDAVRMIVVLSPTWPLCMYGHGVVRGIFETVEGDNLRGFAIWLPMMKGDDAEAAQRASDTFRDARVSHTWDPDRVLGDLAARRLGLTKTGWDLYLLYPAGIVWEGEDLPEPTLWMAQLPTQQGIDDQTLLDPGRLAAEVFRLTGREENRGRIDLGLSLHARGLMEVRKTGEAFQAFLGEAGFAEDLDASCWCMRHRLTLEVWDGQERCGL